MHDFQSVLSCSPMFCFLANQLYYHECVEGYISKMKGGGGGEEYVRVSTVFPCNVTFKPNQLLTETIPLGNHANSRGF